MYGIIFTETAREDVRKLRNEPQAFAKLGKLLAELEIHPFTGTGKPKPLRGDRAGQWSRRITDKHRLIYEVNDKVVEVLVVSTYGHYDDK
ncbi:MAG: Txe/YoeB family addiction module toxin [Tannerella sp.]|jgi:toxin YoeB|nr:Txe/YoeB family addiction module toxin [Tannerella sp.]